MKLLQVVLLLAVVSVITLSMTRPTRAYSRYEAPLEATAGCIQCHDGFAGRGPLHDLHDNMRSSNCGMCHFSNGDDPYTFKSGGSGGLNQGCRGCHGVPNGGTNTFGWATGLRAHHKNAGAPADSDGRRCANCHTSDPVPSPESTVPVYFTNSNVKVKNPCLAAPAPVGEDFDGDSKGLDNNGDLLYDENDNACAFQITTITREGNDIRVSWQSVAGRTNYLQVARADGAGDFNTNFVDVGSMILVSGTVVGTTNRLDIGAATNNPARYYRISRMPGSGSLVPAVKSKRVNPRN